MLGVLVKRCLPWGLLRLEVDLHLADELTHSLEQVPCDGGDRPVRLQGDPLHTPVDVLDLSLVGAQVERDAEGTGAVGRRQWRGFPSPCRQAKRCVLELRLRWSEGHSKLAEHLRVGVQRVAGRAPGVVGQLPPL